MSIYLPMYHINHDHVTFRLYYLQMHSIYATQQSGGCNP